MTEKTEAPDARRRRIQRIALIALLHALVLAALFFTDGATYRWLQDCRDTWSESKSFVYQQLSDDDHWEFFASFGLWLSAVAVVVIVWQVDPRRRRALAALVAGVIVAGVLTSVAAKTIGRVRPGKSGGVTKLMTFGYAWVENKSAAFPSGHATFAGALAAFLTLCLPRLKGFAWVMAVGCGLSRVYFRKHFFSDIYTGLLVGHYSMLWAWSFLRTRMAFGPTGLDADQSEASAGT